MHGQCLVYAVSLFSEMSTHGLPVNAGEIPIYNLTSYCQIHRERRFPVRFNPGGQGRMLNVMKTAAVYNLVY